MIIIVYLIRFYIQINSVTEDKQLYFKMIIGKSKIKFLFLLPELTMMIQIDSYL